MGFKVGDYVRVLDEDGVVGVITKFEERRSSKGVDIYHVDSSICNRWSVAENLKKIPINEYMSCIQRYLCKLMYEDYVMIQHKTSDKPIIEICPKSRKRERIKFNFKL